MKTGQADNNGQCCLKMYARNIYKIGQRIKNRSALKKNPLKSIIANKALQKNELLFYCFQLDKYHCWYKIMRCNDSLNFRLFILETMQRQLLFARGSNTRLSVTDSMSRTQFTSSMTQLYRLQVKGRNSMCTLKMATACQPTLFNQAVSRILSSWAAFQVNI